MEGQPTQPPGFHAAVFPEQKHPNSSKGALPAACCRYYPKRRSLPVRQASSSPSRSVPQFSVLKGHNPDRIANGRAIQGDIPLSATWLALLSGLGPIIAEISPPTATVLNPRSRPDGCGRQAQPGTRTPGLAGQPGS